jgi:hypothetical protein
MRLFAACALAGMAGCGKVTSTTSADAADGAPTCDPLARFDPPVPIPGLEIPGVVALGTPRLSTDELTLYLDGAASGQAANLYVTHRSTRADLFETPAPVMAAASMFGSGNASLSGDGRTLWLTIRPSSTEGYHLYVATRPSSLAEFDPPRKADVVNASDPTLTDAQPFLTADGEELWFMSTRPPSMGDDLWHASRSGTGFGAPIQAVGLSSASGDRFPSLSADRLTIYFGSGRAAPGAKGGDDIWRSHRASVADDFPPPVLVDELNTAGNDYATWLSADNCRLYGTSNNQIFVATRQP